MTGAFSKPTYGATTTLLVLGMALFLGVMVIMTLTLNLAGQRKASSNRLGQQVQYAAESSLARANARLDQYAGRINSIVLPDGINYVKVDEMMAKVCNVPTLPLPANFHAIDKAGQRLCNAPNKGHPTATQVEFFATYSPRPAPFTQAAWQQEWLNIFSGESNTLVDKATGTLTSTNGTTSTSVKGGLQIEGVSIMPDGSYRVDFSVSPLTADASLSTAGNTSAFARRRYQQEGSKVYSLNLGQPSLSRFQYMVNRRTLATGERLVFWDGDSFEGHVHANGVYGQTGPLFLANSSNGGPRFNGEFSTTVSQTEWSRTSPYKVDDSLMFKGKTTFGADPVKMPTNAVKQRLAAAGLDSRDCPNLTTSPSTAMASCLSSVYGSQVTTTDGVYFASGSNASANSGSQFAGGIYVRGSVSNLKMSQVLPQKLQRIEITQNGKVTTFTQTSSTSWTVAVNGTVTKTLSNTTFNGMLYVDGNIGAATPKGDQGLMGDGTSAGDIAPDMQLTIAAQGNIYLKQSLTYAVDPATDPSAKNVLGIFSEGGNFLLNGPSGDLTVNGSIMASSDGHGFGTVDFRTNRGNPQPKINLMGGIIEEQSQGVGTTSATSGGGYSRNFKWDARFNDPRFAPPFFPNQENYVVTNDLDLNGTAKHFKLSQNFRAVASQ